MTVTPEVLTTPHQVVVDASIDTGSESVPVALVSGKVDVDRGRIWRRELTAVLHPDTDRALLQPRGHRLSVRRGLVVPDGRTVTAPLIVGRLGGYSRDSSTGGWTVTARSLEWEVLRAEFLAPRSSSGPSCQQMIRELVIEAVPDAYFVSTATRDAPVPAVVHEKDRWRAIDGTDESLCRAIGAELFCAADGTFVLADVPDPSDPPVFITREGEAMVGWSESSTEDGVINVVAATGERVDGEGPLPFGLWWDDNPASPTYVGDVAHQLLSGVLTVEELLATGVTDAVRGFGVSPHFLASPLLLTDAQAGQAAYTYGRSRLGTLRSVAFSSVTDPWRDAGQVGDIEVDGTFERHLIERLSIDVTDLGSAMDAETRTVPL